MKKIFKKKTTIFILLLLVLGGYFGYRALSSGNEATRYTLAQVSKDTLIVSVSGSGQIAVLDQADIKPKSAGDIVAIYIQKDQVVWFGQLLALLDTKEAERTIRDAEVALENAQRDLTESEEDYGDITVDAERSLSEAYEDGYSNVSTIFFKLSDYMKDLKDVLGTEESTQEYVTGYELILGRDSLFIQRLMEDYEEAFDLFNENFEFFREVYREDDHDIIYQLINDTLATTKTISLALESARHMYDAITIQDYQRFRNIASQIDEMKPKIESDVSAVYSNISSLQKIKDTIDETGEETPDKIEEAKLNIQSLQNNVVQKEEALADAKEKLADCYIYSPFNGVVAEMGDVKRGDTVSANTVLATVVTNQKIAELTLNEVDAANVKVSQKATLTFDALPDLSITGKVLEVDTIGQVSQGVVSYGVKITFDTEVEQIKPGMSVTADIITQAKSDVLVLPSTAIKSQGDSYYVELVELDEQDSSQLLANVSGVILAESPQVQIVEIGLSNDLSTEIVSGLAEGDVVISQTVSSNSVSTAIRSGTQMEGGMIRIMR